MRGLRVGGWALSCAAVVVASSGCASTAEEPGGRGGDSIRSVASPLSVPSGSPYIDFYQDAPDPDAVALTFDDGPDQDGHCDSVLDTLKANGVKATFFVNSNNFENVAYSSPAQHTLARMVNEGHQVGNHTVHHYDLSSSSYDVEKELSGVETALDAYAPGWKVHRLARAPYGNPYFGPQSRLDVVAPIFAKHGVHIGWNVDALDWDCNSAAPVRRAW